MAIWGSASTTQTLKVQRFQNRVIRLITSVPWYVRNDTPHTDLNMTDVSTTIDKTYTKLHLTMRENVNPLIQDTGQHLPPPGIARRLKRKHHSDNLEPTDA
jgi:hypothetical protein